MTVLYVDTEHDAIALDDARGPAHRAKLEAIRLRVASAAGEQCVALRAHEITPFELERLRARAVVLSGSTTDWSLYDFASLEGLFEVIRDASVPILGICAGHQLIGYAHGGNWEPLDALQPGETDPDPRFAPGIRKERGFLEVEVESNCQLFRGLDDRPVFFQSHYWRLQDAPSGFDVRAWSAWTRVQVIERRDHPVFGVQFHPERYDSAHQDGRTLLRNFFTIVNRRAE